VSLFVLSGPMAARWLPIFHLPGLGIASASLLLAALGLAALLTLTGCGGDSSADTAGGKDGVTLTIGDQAKTLQTIVAASGAHGECAEAASHDVVKRRGHHSGPTVGGLVRRDGPASFPGGEPVQHLDRRVAFGVPGFGSRCIGGVAGISCDAEDREQLAHEVTSLGQLIGSDPWGQGPTTQLCKGVEIDLYPVSGHDDLPRSGA